MYGLLTWLPTFFSDYYGVEVGDLGGFTLLPYVVQVGGGADGAARHACGIMRRNVMPRSVIRFS
jgi:hypothetical protein